LARSSSDVLKLKAKALLDALEDERRNHGDLVTAKRRRAENELRLALVHTGEGI
jgi:hypothetical protein